MVDQVVRRRRWCPSGRHTSSFGDYLSARSPVRSAPGITYLLVTLEPGQSWTFTPPADQTVAWLAVARGSVATPERVKASTTVTIVSMVARSARLQDFVRDTLRMRPHCIVVGEMREGLAAPETLKSWNTGYPGGLSTIHANSAQDALRRFEDLVAEVSSQVPRRAIGEAIERIVHIRRTPGGRRVDEVLAVQGVQGDGYRLAKLA